MKIISSIQALAAVPLDSRSVVSDIASRDAIENRYTGMEVFVLSEYKRYMLIGGTSNDNWVRVNQAPDSNPPALARYAMVTTVGEEVYAYSSSTTYSNVPWTRTGNSLTLYRPSHGLVSGDRIILRGVNVELLNVEVSSAGTDNFTVPTDDTGSESGWMAAYGLGFSYAHNVTGSSKVSGTLTRPGTAAGELYMHTLSIRTGATRADTVYTVYLPNEDISSTLITGTAVGSSMFIVPNVQVRRADGGLAPYAVVTVTNGTTYSIGGSDENYRINMFF